MANLNKVMLMGNLTRDPELRYTPKGTAVTDISMAINRSWTDEGGNKQEETTFVEVTVFGRRAEVAQQYLTKGRGVFVEGRLSLDTWDDKQTGQKRSKLKIIAEGFEFLPDGRANKTGGPPPQSGPQTASPPQQRPQGASAAPADDYAEEDDIPF